MPSRIWPVCYALEAASKLVMALRKNLTCRCTCTHDTAGGQMATYYAAALSGADIVDGASAPLAGTTSQPSLSALIAAFSQSKRDTGIDLQAVSDLGPMGGRAPALRPV